MVKFNKNYYICFGFTIIIIQQNAQIHDIVICQFHRITAHHPVDSASKKVDLWIEIMTIIRYAWCEQKIGAKTMWAGAFELWNKNETKRIEFWMKNQIWTEIIVRKSIYLANVKLLWMGRIKMTVAKNRKKMVCLECCSKNRS